MNFYCTIKWLSYTYICILFTYSFPSCFIIGYWICAVRYHLAVFPCWWAAGPCRVVGHRVAGWPLLYRTQLWRDRQGDGPPLTSPFGMKRLGLAERLRGGEGLPDFIWTDAQKRLHSWASGRTASTHVSSRGAPPRAASSRPPCLPSALPFARVFPQGAHSRPWGRAHRDGDLTGVTDAPDRSGRHTHLFANLVSTPLICNCMFPSLRSLLWEKSPWSGWERVCPDHPAAGTWAAQPAGDPATQTRGAWDAARAPHAAGLLPERQRTRADRAPSTPTARGVCRRNSTSKGWGQADTQQNRASAFHNYEANWKVWDWKACIFIRQAFFVAGGGGGGFLSWSHCFDLPRPLKTLAWGCCQPASHPHGLSQPCFHFSHRAEPPTANSGLHRTVLF